MLSDPPCLSPFPPLRTPATQANLCCVTCHTVAHSEPGLPTASPLEHSLILFVDSEMAEDESKHDHIQQSGGN